MPVLGDNPLMLAAWREGLPTYIQAANPSLMSLVKYGILLDSGGGIIFQSLIQATDYYQGELSSHSFKAPAATPYVRPADVNARYAAAKIPDVTRADLERKHIVSEGHIEQASASLLAIICKTVTSRHTRDLFNKKAKGCGLTFLKWLDSEITRIIDDDAVEAIESAITGFFTLGLADHSPSAFNSTANQIELWNRVLEGDARHIGEPALAGKFQSLMRKELGKSEYAELKRDRE